MKLFDLGGLILVMFFMWGLVQAGVEEGEGYRCDTNIVVSTDK